VPLHSVGRSDGFLRGHASDFSHSCGAQSRSCSTDARLFDAPPHAPRGQRQAPLPTPVRSMAVQTNRESIMRHYKESGGVDSDSNSDKDIAVDAVEKDPQAPQGPSALTSARSGMTGFALGDKMSILNTARSVFRKLRYPQQAVYETPDRMIRAASKARVSRSVSNADLAEALSCAINDEYEALAQTWGVGCPGQENRMEDRVALCLKKVAKRAEKTCVEALASRKVTTSLGDNVSADRKVLDDECVELEAQIVATDRRLARMREALSGAPYTVQLDPHNVVKDLLDRLSRDPDSDDIVPPCVVEFENTMNESVQGLIQRLIAAGSSCQRLPNRQKEILGEKNAALSTASTTSIPTAISVLRRLT